MMAVVVCLVTVALVVTAAVQYARHDRFAQIAYGRKPLEDCWPWRHFGPDGPRG